MENRFKKIIEQVKNGATSKRCAVVCPDENTRLAAKHAEAMGLIQASYFEDAKQAVIAVHHGEQDMILKGNVDTSVLLKEIVHKEYGLLTGSLISHVAVLDVPRYHKLLMITDGGMVMYPGLDQLQGILNNALEAIKAFDVKTPKVACLAAVEKVHERMPETLRAAELKALSQKGVFGDAQVEGPISFDLAFEKEAAQLKGYDSPVAGDADIFLVPDFVSGNLLAKSLVYGGGARFAGFLMGARTPVVLTSRSASTDEKIYSIACSALVAADQG